MEREDFDEMLGNLMDNAAKWARSTVRVTVARHGRMLRLAVEDDGPGMPPEATELVFEVGTRLDEQVPGSGLGLAIVRDIVQLCGREIRLAASGLGGLAAIILVPATDAPG